MGYNLDKEDGFSFTLFKCEVSANDCSQCLAIDSTDRQRKCGWCTDTPKDQFTCTVVQECSAVWTDDVNSASCPEPRITGFKPSQGPKDGGTNLTIEGSNLGIKLADISSVTVGGIPCEVIAERYTPGIIIVCTTQAAPSELSGKLFVEINQETVESNENFTFVDVTVTGYKPTKGPAAGGTKVTVYGNHLDSGSEVEVTLAGVDCMIKERASNYLVCTTKAFNLPALSRYSPNSSVSGDLQVIIDQAMPTKNGNFVPFIYTPNPTVFDIVPKVGLAAGGIPITVTGDWLNSIQQPLIVLFSENYVTSFPCQPATERRTMTCVQPSYPDPVTADRSVEVNVTFVMDDVPRMSLQLKQSFLFRSNPVFRRLSSPGETVLNIDDDDDDDSIILEGNNLDVVGMQYYVIEIGNSKLCNVTDLAATLLRCTPDKGQDGETLPLIVIKMIVVLVVFVILILSCTR
jgi:plexin A